MSTLQVRRTRGLRQTLHERLNDVTGRSERLELRWLSLQGRPAVPVLIAPCENRPSELLKRLGLDDAQAVLLLLGGTAEDATEGLELRNVFRRDLLPVLAWPGVLIIDGGTDAGALASLDEALRDHPGHRLGVTPYDKVSMAGEAGRQPHDLGPGHTHFILTLGEKFGDETPLLVGLADALAQAGVPIAALIVGGGSGSLVEVEQVVARGWPLLVLAESGRLANRIETLVTPTKGWRRGQALQRLDRQETAAGLGAETERRLDKLSSSLREADVTVVSGEEAATATSLRAQVAWRLPVDRLLRADVPHFS